MTPRNYLFLPYLVFRLGLDSDTEVRIIERCINMSLLVQ